MQTRLTPTPALSIGDLIWQAFFSPVEGLSSAARQQPIGWAIAFIVVIPFVSTLVWWTPQTAYHLGYPLMVLFDSFWKAMLISLLIAPLLFLLSSAALHGISWLFGGGVAIPNYLAPWRLLPCHLSSSSFFSSSSLNLWGISERCLRCWEI